MNRIAVDCLLFISAAMLLTACVGPSSVPDDHFYQLPGPSADSAEIKTIKGTIAIAQLRSDGLHRERAILYIDPNQPLEVHRYHYHHWTKSPPRLIQEHMLTYLRSKQFATHIVRQSPNSKADGIIGGKLSRFERILDKKVMVAIELNYRSNKHPDQTWVKTYKTTIASRDKTLHSAAQAFGVALIQIYDAFLNDLHAHLDEESLP